MPVRVRVSNSFLHPDVFFLNLYTMKGGTSLVFVFRSLQCLNDPSGYVFSLLLGKGFFGFFQFLSHPSLQILHSFKMFCSLFAPFTSLSGRLKFNCSCRVRNALGDVFNTDVLHYVFGRFQLSHDHYSKARFVICCFRSSTPLSLKSHCAASFPFLWYVYARQHKPIIRQILSRAVSCHCAPCFPFVSDRNVVSNLHSGRSASLIFQNSGRFVFALVDSHSSQNVLACLTSCFVSHSIRYLSNLLSISQNFNQFPRYIHQREAPGAASPRPVRSFQQ